MPLVGIGTLPTPFSPASVPLPPETGGRGHTSLRVGGWGEFQFRRGAYTVVLFICTYFVTVLFSPVSLNPTSYYLKRFSLQGPRHLFKRLRSTGVWTAMTVRWNLEHSEMCFFYLTKSIGRITSLCKHIMITIFYFVNHKLYNFVKKWHLYSHWIQQWVTIAVYTSGLSRELRKQIQRCR